MWRAIACIGAACVIAPVGASVTISMGGHWSTGAYVTGVVAGAVNFAILSYRGRRQ